MAGIALSRFGIPPDVFYELTPKEFQYALDDHVEREEVKLNILNENIKATNRTIWTAIRWQTMFIFNPHAKKGKRVNRPEQLGRFDWEKEKKLSPAAIIAMFRAMGARIKNKKE